MGENLSFILPILRLYQNNEFNKKNNQKLILMLPIEFKPQNEYELIRLGQDNDGGYLVDKKSIDDSKSLITLGLGFDWTF